MKKKLLWLIVIVVIVFSSMAISTIENDKSSLIGDVAGIIAKPFQKLFLGIDNFIEYGFDYFQDMDELKKENAELKSKVMLLENKVTESEQIRSENERLRSLVDLGEKYKDYDMTAASVIAVDTSGWYSYFIIDKGESDGISKNCVAMDSGGVLGKVDEVGSSWARIMTIAEPGTACGAEVSRTGETGIIEGDSLLSGMCKMTSISKEANITPGDYIVTSGSGDVYPSGLTIGRVKEIREEDISRTAIVEPTGNLRSPKEVVVITGKYAEDTE
ncbi:MAG: rod shape-determining protein MreC [Clostridia bacterium]|nr:rod shape-determining protein MreC [Clostridia bacterium]